MILDDTIPVVVPYRVNGAPEKIADCLARLKGPAPDMSAIRELQPYLTAMRRSTAQRGDVVPMLRKVVGDLHEWIGEYDPDYGVVAEPEGADFIC